MFRIHTQFRRRCGGKVLDEPEQTVATEAELKLALIADPSAWAEDTETHEAIRLVLQRHGTDHSSTE